MKYKIVKIILVSSLFFNVGSSFADCLPEEMSNLRNSTLAAYKAKEYESAEQKLAQRMSVVFMR